MARSARRVPARRRRRAPTGVRKRRAPRRGGKKAVFNPQRQTARIVESIQLSDILSDQGYTHNFSLSQFYRATTLAKNFRFYKAAKVKWEYMPYYNVFQEGNSSGTVSKPQMYFMMNRDQNNLWQGQNAATCLFNIQSAGADPVPLTSNREIIYTPNWCSPGMTALTFSPVDATGGGSVQAVTNVIACGLKKQYGWLPTPDLDSYDSPKDYNPVDGAARNDGTGQLSMGPVAAAGVLYNGHDVFIEQRREPDTPICTLVCTVEWLFKGAKNNYNQITNVTDVSGAQPSE